MKADQLLDAKGLACPMPIVRTKKAINTIEVGQVLEIHTTDKGSLADITAWTKSTGHELLGGSEENGIFKFFVKKGE
ncbi:sulfurtransferase TusA family protein [Bacillus sp. JJ722]|uniref:sulfurtransferase TusA family protein n=1 Tax=Bacillus sp. JJ722 TaxID=3122973 RepID=UPI0030006DCF